MIKKYRVAILVLASSIGLTAHADSLIDAISSNNSKKVKSLLAQPEVRDSIDSGYKKILSQVAQEACVMAQHNCKFFRRNWDMGKVALGALLILGSNPQEADCSAWLTAQEIEFVQNPILIFAERAVGVVLLVQGLRMTSAQARERAAREIHLLIEALP